MVTFESGAPTGLGGSCFALASALRGLFGIHVDLIEERAIRNPYFRQAVDTGPKVGLYKSPTAPKRRRAVPHPAPECSPVQLRTKKYLYDITPAAGNVM